MENISVKAVVGCTVKVPSHWPTMERLGSGWESVLPQGLEQPDSMDHPIARKQSINTGICLCMIMFLKEKGPFERPLGHRTTVLFLGGEVRFRRTAERTDPIFREILKCGSWGDSIVRITLDGVIHISAKITNVLLHGFPPYLS